MSSAPILEGVGPLVVSDAMDAKNQSNSSLQFGQSTMPVIAEDYTATWCENCVKAEHAMDDIEEDQNLVQLHFHPYNDSQDPFGTTDGDQWWERRNGERQAPFVVIHGKWKHLGSASKQFNTLEEDYSASAQAAPDLDDGILSWQWTPSGNGGIINWSLDNGDGFSKFTDYSLAFFAFTVEESAYFPDGSNGLDNYPHIVSSITPLGSEKSGEVEIEVPQAHDGDDMTIHLVMELIPPPQEEGGNVESSLVSNEVLLYSGGIGGVVAILVLILLLKKKAPSIITENEVLPERSTQQLAYEEKMLEMGWQADKAREFADQHFEVSPPQ
jgi:glutaredoxin